MSLHEFQGILTQEELEAVEQLGRKYDYGWGIDHAVQVARLALKLWLQLKEPLNLPDNTLKPLIVVALLHDIGRQVEYEEQHHEKSYHAILESPELKAALDEETITIAAHLALHHRSETGDPREYPQTPPEYADTIARLAAILRLADALDYTLSSIVEDVEVTIASDKAVVKVKALEPCTAELGKAEEKKQLLEELLGRPVELEAELSIAEAL